MSTISSLDLSNFAGTARLVGYTGDIVFCMDEDIHSYLKQIIVKMNIVLYKVQNKECTSGGTCSIYNLPHKYSINMLRYFLYQWYDKYIIIL
jgi:hypothetical protein